MPRWTVTSLGATSVATTSLLEPTIGGHGPRAPHHHLTQDPIWTTPVSPLMVRLLKISKATEAYAPLIIRAKTSESKWLTRCVQLYRCGLCVYCMGTASLADDWYSLF